MKELISVPELCEECSKCERNCPQNAIRVVNGVPIFCLEWGWVDFAYHLAVTHHDGTVDIGLGKRHQGVEECYDLLAFYSSLLWGNTRKIAGLGFCREKPKGE